MFRAFSILLRSLHILWRFPLRSALTILGAGLGVAGALTSIHYALGGRAKILGQLGRLGANVLIVTPAASRNVGSRARTGAPVTTLTPADYVAIRKETPLFGASSAYFTRSYLVKAGDLTKNNCVVVGIEPDYLAIKNWPIREGAPLSAQDSRRSARLALLGSTVARDLFGSASPVGRRLLINRIPFEVAGVLTERGQGLDSSNEDDQVYIPLPTAMHRVANVEYYSGIVFSVDRLEQLDRAAAAAAAILRRRHRSSVKLPEDFQALNQKRLIDTQTAASGQLLFYVRWIGFGALAVSGFGILAISWIGVRERTREIGTRRALGATQADIFNQILWESAVLSATGCLLGLLTASQASARLSVWAAQPEVWDRATAIAVVAVSATLNLSAAALPAWGAARLDPIQALRFE